MLSTVSPFDQGKPTQTSTVIVDDACDLIKIKYESVMPVDSISEIVQLIQRKFDNGLNYLSCYAQLQDQVADVEQNEWSLVRNVQKTCCQGEMTSPKSTLHTSEFCSMNGAVGKEKEEFNIGVRVRQKQTGSPLGNLGNILSYPAIKHHHTTKDCLSVSSLPVHNRHFLNSFGIKDRSSGRKDFYYMTTGTEEKSSSKQESLSTLSDKTGSCQPEDWKEYNDVSSHNGKIIEILLNNKEQANITNLGITREKEMQTVSARERPVIDPQNHQEKLDSNLSGQKMLTSEPLGPVSDRPTGVEGLASKKSNRTIFEEEVSTRIPISLDPKYSLGSARLFAKSHAVTQRPAHCCDSKRHKRTEKGFRRDGLSLDCKDMLSEDRFHPSTVAYSVHGDPNLVDDPFTETPWLYTNKRLLHFEELARHYIVQPLYHLQEYRSEWARLASFAPMESSLPTVVHVNRLAESGFYYSSQNGEIVCFSCGLKWSRPWVTTQQCHERHLELRPECKHANGRDDTNIPIQKNAPTRQTDPDRQADPVVRQSESVARESDLVEGNTCLTSAQNRPTQPIQEVPQASSSASETTYSGDSQQRALSDDLTTESSAVELQNNVTTDSDLQSHQQSFEATRPSKTLSAAERASGRNFATPHRRKGPTSFDFENLSVDEPLPRATPEAIERQYQLTAASVGTAVPQSYLSPLLNPNHQIPHTQHAQVYHCTTTTPAVIVPSETSTTVNVYRYPVQAEQDHQIVPNDTDQVDGDLEQLVTGLNMRRAVSPGHAMVAVRLSTFASWPERGLPDRRLLVLAGFHYLGMADSVRCFYCGVTLKNWRADDDVWETHVRFRFSCDYVVFIKGENFVTTTLIKLANGGRIPDGNGPAVLPPLPLHDPTAGVVVASTAVRSGRIIGSAVAEAVLAHGRFEGRQGARLVVADGAVSNQEPTASRLVEVNGSHSSPQHSESLVSPLHYGTVRGDDAATRPTGNRPPSRYTSSDVYGNATRGGNFAAHAGEVAAEDEISRETLTAHEGEREATAVDNSATVWPEKGAATSSDRTEVRESGVDGTRTLWGSNRTRETTPALQTATAESSSTERGEGRDITDGPLSPLNDLQTDEMQAGPSQTAQQVTTIQHAVLASTTPPVAVAVSHSGSSLLPATAFGGTSSPVVNSSFVTRLTSVSTEYPVTSRSRSDRVAGTEDLTSNLQQLSDINRRLRQLRTCRVCGQRGVDTIFLPCGHLVTCEACAANTRDCCLCRERIRGTAHVFLE